MKLNTLIVQTEEQSTRLLLSVLKKNEFELFDTSQVDEAKIILDKNPVDLVFFDLHYAGEEWQNFLRWIKINHPLTKVILTSKFPDLQREMIAQDMGIKVFLRQPYTKQWVEFAIEKAGLVPLDASKKGRNRSGSTSSTSFPKVRVPVQLKITLPYLVLAVLFALASAYIISQVVFDSVQDRYFNQLIASSKQASDWMVREENRLLSTLRIISTDPAIGDAIKDSDIENLQEKVLQIGLQTNEDAFEVLDLEGKSIISLRKKNLEDPEAYQLGTGKEAFQNQDFVINVIRAVSDEQGDKFAGYMQLTGGDYFFVSGPIFSSDGSRSGVILVGASLEGIVREIQSNTLAHVTLYDQAGNEILSTFNSDKNLQIIPESQVSQLVSNQDKSSISREVSIDSVKFTELLGIWEVRSGLIDLGFLGISLPQSYLVNASQVTRFQVFALSLTAILMIVFVGVFLANIITRPLVKLVGASMEVANGNLDVKVESKGNDEVAVLAHSFNSMIAGLQEGSIYRDLLGRSVSPEVREQLRHTFSSGDLRLDGQDAIATVMFADIRDFTSLAEKSDSATIFEWLNEYFGVLIPIVTENNGVVNKLDGDSVLAFFGILPKILSPQMSAFN
ncbi:MAG: HAMP domain-containing protein, partial [Geobacter sp.]